MARVVAVQFGEAAEDADVVGLAPGVAVEREEAVVGLSGLGVFLGFIEEACKACEGCGVGGLEADEAFEGAAEFAVVGGVFV
jgi:hypothetical protein